MPEVLGRGNLISSKSTEGCLSRSGVREMGSLVHRRGRLPRAGLEVDRTSEVFYKRTPGSPVSAQISPPEAQKGAPTSAGRLTAQPMRIQNAHDQRWDITPGKIASIGKNTIVGAGGQYGTRPSPDPQRPGRT